MSTLLARRLAAFEREVFHDPARISVSQWADQHRIVVPPTPKPGRWETSFVEYLREPMDAAGDPRVEEVTLMCAAQVGKTELIINLLGYLIDRDPAEVILVCPRDTDAATMLRTRIRPNFEATAPVARHMTKRRKDNQKHYVRFGRARLHVAGANSPAALASKPCRVGIVDETDKCPTIGKGGREGDAVSLVRDRLITYHDRKFFKCSTPTTRAGSVWNEFEAGDKRRYHVPCPLCGAFQELAFQNLRKPPDIEPDRFRREDLVYYECASCKGHIRHAQKQAMVARGLWVPEGSTVEDGVVTPGSTALHRSYHMSALISPWLTWGEVMYEWIQAQGNLGRLINFVNGYLGWIWEEQAEATRSADVQAMVDEAHTGGVVPPWAFVLTAGVDVGIREVHYTVRAWGPGERSVTIVTGRADSNRAAYDILTSRVFRKADNSPVLLRAIAWDSAYQTDEVYALARRNPVVRPVKGQRSIAGIPLKAARIERNSRGSPAKHASTLWHVDTSHYKDKLVRMMRAKPDEPGYWRIAADIPDEFFRHLTSEHKVYVRTRLGGVSPEWQVRPGGGANHWLDAEVYALAAADMVGVFAVQPQPAAGAAPASISQPAAAPRRQGLAGSGRRGAWLGSVRGRW